MKVIWLGKKQSQQGNSYHDWDVLVNNSVEPISVGAVPTGENDNPPSTTVPTENAPQAAAGSAMDDDDDLPF